jgi:anti-sigma regulatory factor (Ser/Thr protein kinase)
MIHAFFRANLADVSYMTALICIHRPLVGHVRWISCGAPDLIVVDNGEDIKVNPDHRGGLPIGLFPDTVYTPADVVETPLAKTALCLAYTDGIVDISRDYEGNEKLPISLSKLVRKDLAECARRNGDCIAAPAKYIKALSDIGYDKCQDDISLLMFGATDPVPGMYEATVKLLPNDVDTAAQDVGKWCREQGWPEDGIMKIQLVLEEKLMNVHDHGFDDRDRLREVVSLRLKRIRDHAVLTVWDAGTEEPSVKVAVGDAETAFELANQNMSAHGRGRLMVRQLCDGIERNRYPPINETTYHIPIFGKKAEQGKDNTEAK